MGRLISVKMRSSKKIVVSSRPPVVVRGARSFDRAKRKMKWASLEEEVRSQPPGTGNNLLLSRSTEYIGSLRSPWSRSRLMSTTGQVRNIYDSSKEKKSLFKIRTKDQETNMDSDSSFLLILAILKSSLEVLKSIENKTKNLESTCPSFEIKVQLLDKTLLSSFAIISFRTCQGTHQYGSRP